MMSISTGGMRKAAKPLCGLYRLRCNLTVLFHEFSAFLQGVPYGIACFGVRFLYFFKYASHHDDLDEYDFGEDEDADEEPAEIEIHSEDGQEDET